MQTHSVEQTHRVVTSAEQLEAARQQMDPLADAVVRQVFERGEREAVNALLVHVVDNDQLVPEALPGEVQAYLRESSALPAWADADAIARAEAIFATHGPLCFAVLIASSLPETYALPSIADALGTTQQLEAHATRRILKTAQLLVDVLSPGGLGPGGRGVRAAQRVRLLHASIRHMILHAKPALTQPEAKDVRTLAGALENTVWPSAERGAPICQEDMAYTILTFSCVVLDGLAKLRQELSDADRDAFVHTWAVVGALMGVRDDLLPRDLDGARRLLQAIHGRQARASEPGRLLTQRTVDAFQDLLDARVLPSFLHARGLALLVVRTLLSPQTADITGVPRLTLLQRMLAVPLMHAATIGLGLIDWLGHEDRAALFIQKVVSKHMVDHLSALSERDAHTLFFIPAELHAGWNETHG